MKITQKTFNNEYIDLFVSGESVGNDVQMLQHIIDKCKSNNEKYTMSKSVQQIYKSLN